MIEIESDVGMLGRFRLQVFGPDGGLRKDTGWFNNLILDAGLNRIGSGLAVATYCHVGAGSSAPTVSETSLQSLIGTAAGSSSSGGFDSTGAAHFGWERIKYRFEAGVAAGNVSEVGVGWGTGASSLFSRALILDAGGTPNTITVLPDEVLDVTYELRLYPPMTDTSFVLPISGTNYSCVGRASNAQSGYWSPGRLMLYGTNSSSPSLGVYSGTIGAMSGVPSGSSASSSFSYDAYSNNSLQRTGVASYNLTTGNFAGGIQALSLACPGDWQMQFSVTPAIPKNNTKVLTIRVVTSWSRKTI